MIMGFIELVQKKIADLQMAALRDSIKKKTDIRKRFYITLRDFINGAGNRPPHSYFGWYEGQLDSRMSVEPSWKRLFFKLTKKKNDSGYRQFIKACETDLQKSSDFLGAIKPWIPSDEYRLLKSAQGSNISREIDLAIQMVVEKDNLSKQIRGIVKKNIPMFIVGFFIHFILYEFVYKSLLNIHAIADLSFGDMSIPEKVLSSYAFVIDNWLMIAIGIAIFGLLVGWSNKNWHKIGFNLRVNYFDYLPPYSITKVKEQYNFLMLLNSFIQSGKNFNDAVDEAAQGASPYVKKHIRQIQNRSTMPANEAINIPFLGEYGCDIKERGENVQLGDAISDLLPEISIMKDEKLDNVVGVSMWLTTKPLIYGSLGISCFGVVMTIVEMVTSSGVMDSGFM